MARRHRCGDRNRVRDRAARACHGAHGDVSKRSHPAVGERGPQRPELAADLRLVHLQPHHSRRAVLRGHAPHDGTGVAGHARGGGSGDRGDLGVVRKHRHGDQSLSGGDDCARLLRRQRAELDERHPGVHAGIFARQPSALVVDSRVGRRSGGRRGDGHPRQPHAEHHHAHLADRGDQALAKRRLPRNFQFATALYSPRPS